MLCGRVQGLSARRALLVAAWLATAAFASDGDNQLLQAFNAGFIRVLEDGSLIALLQNESAYYSMVQDCVMDSSYYPYPENPVGSLKHVLETGVFRTGYTLLISGSISDLVIQKMGEHYGVSITVNGTHYDTSDELWAALDAGTVDCTGPAWTVGGFAGTKRRNVEWQATCASYCLKFYVASLRSHNITNVTQLQAKLSERWMLGIPSYIATATSAETQLLSQLLHVYIDQCLTRDEALAALDDSDNVLAATVASRDTVLDAKYVKYETPYISPVATFCRREVDDQYKVETTSNLPYWKTGNEHLAQIYEAALMSLKATGDFNKIFSSYGVKVVEYCDCYTSYTNYPIPSVFDGTLDYILNVNHTFTLADVRADSYLLNSSAVPPSGPFHTLNFAVVDWITRELSLTRPLKLQYLLFNTSEEALEAVITGKADATSNYFWTGGAFNGTLRTTTFRSVCSSAAFYATVWTLRVDYIISVEALRNVLAANPDLKLGAVSLSARFALQSLFKGTHIVDYANNYEAQYALTHNYVVAVSPEWTKTPPSYVYEITTPVIQPITAFFRKDMVDSCSDNELDAQYGEECLPTDDTCTDQCTCRDGFHKQSPLQQSCEKNTHSHDYTLAIVLGVVLGTVALVLVLLVLGVILVAAVAFPLVRKKYRTEGATSFRNHLFGHRW
eukprot:TRINITY_DN6942_c0_g1_i1.p1 TRINITY_DN6942_c0_g1~~TRINITY_DN6942_c0_g1_i1.p1  ORF type:complete len:674 (-),score=145.78 TRINITY_DN6942_c0_g1_i1:69-2090(-)